MQQRSSASFIAALAALAIAPWAVARAQIQTAQPQLLPRPTPGWETKVANPNDPNYHLPAYPIAFVKAPLVEHNVQVCDTGNPPYNCSSNLSGCNPAHIVTAKEGDYYLGTDVLTVNDPDPGNELWIYLPATGAVKKLFPRPIHEQTGVIDFPLASGSVVEPNLSEDGTRIYFAYYQDATDAYSTNEYLSKIPWSGADLYAIDIGPLLTAPATNPDTLIVTRLTHRVYAANHKQAPADRDKDAMNPNLAAATTWNHTEWGTAYLHPVEVRTRNGLYLAYVSNKRRLDNADQPMLRQNHNFNLHMAPILPDGTLGPEDNQFQYYTTMSALSPAPLRQGLSFSFQATTEDSRNWHIQGIDSEGRWYPIIGYGSNPELFHLATFCAGSTGDYLVATKYYNLNNEGFGSLWKQDLSIAVLGKNTYNNPVQGQWRVPMQVGSQELTDPPGPNSSLSADYPSDKNPATGAYWGKFTSPRCGGVDELYFAYTPTSANSHLFDEECNMAIYHAYIGFRPNLSAWTPGAPVSGNGHHVVIRRTNDDANLLWPVPIVPWSVRSNGDAVQQVAATPVLTPTPHIAPGEPFAQVGTSALWNTDRRPFECRYVQPASGPPKWYSPWGLPNGNVNQENDLIATNQDGWTYVDTPGPNNDFCQLPDRSRILGIAINVTSNKANQSYYFGYSPKLETARLLGIYDVRPQGNDQSFQAIIPANMPFELQALDSAYGMKLADVRSWHSLKAREVRTDCGGCHQHDVNAAPVSFTNTYADTHAPLDMVRSTPSIGYDANCRLRVDPPDNQAAEDYPEWRADVWPQMDAFCGSCHNSMTGNGTGNAALSWPDTGQTSGDNVYSAIVNRRFASSERGALGSQLFWAARGHRTDNRSNTAYPASYACTSCSNAARWGFFYSSAHNALYQNCVNAVPGFAAWAFKLGKWIDNHMLRNTGYAMGAKFDWYHPTADFALISPTCAPTLLQVGWWDDSDKLKSIKVWLDDNVANPLYSQVWPGLPATPIANGKTSFALPAVSSSDWITVEVRDIEDNRQIYRKGIDQLLDECVVP